MPLSLLVVGSENPRIRDFFSQVARYANVSYLDTSPVGRIPDFDRLSQSWRWRNAAKIPPKPISSYRADGPIYPPISPTGSAAEPSPNSAMPTPSFSPGPSYVFSPKNSRISPASITAKTRSNFGTGAPNSSAPSRTRLLNNVDAVFAVSRLLASDLAPRTPGRTFYLPNGFCDWFLPDQNLLRPTDLPTGKPLIGSVGQINKDYDWDYVSTIAAALPDVTLCFIGQLDEPDKVAERRVHRTITTTPNILWLGFRKYQQLPAYMRHFDILMNFLKADDLGNRRSPLRLYDYLTTDRPIISTGVTEAYEHQPHVHVAPDASQAITLIRQILADQHQPDPQSRRAYIRNHSWQNRAQQFLNELTPIIAAKSRGMAIPRSSSPRS